jgi:cytidylate kinase
MGASVVCISRTLGAGGEEVGHLVAERLAFAYVDEDIVRLAAEKGHISPADVSDAEHRHSTLRRLFEGFGKGSVAETYGLAPAMAGGDVPEDMAALIREAIEEWAGRGEVVIVAHGASFALAERSDVLRVLVTASRESRVQRLAESASMSPRQAEKAVDDSDAARADYLRRIYGVHDEAPSQYDLVLDTGELGIARAAELVADAAR